MERHTKKSPNKKRHTKPCKFFQLATCPYTAEECDFAHVIASQPALQNSKPCRYFLAGNCGNGIWCRYNHQILGGAGILDEVMPYNQAIDDVCVPMSPYQGVYITSPVWPVYSPVNYAVDSPSAIFPSSDSIPSPSTSDSAEGSTIVSDSDFFSASEDLHIEASFPSVEEYPGSKRSSYSQSPLVSPTIPHSPLTYPVPPIYDMFPQLSPRSSRHKAQGYKTKPCKFYNPQLNRHCPRGDRCSFIHDLPHNRPADQEHELPTRPLSLADENKKRGYYPITWRVIGGGVLIGNPTKKRPQPEPRPVLSVGVDFPKLDSISDDVFFKVTPRARASSIPSTPSTTHVDMQSLFSAESPGGL